MQGGSPLQASPAWIGAPDKLRKRGAAHCGWLPRLLCPRARCTPAPAETRCGTLVAIQPRSPLTPQAQPSCAAALSTRTTGTSATPRARSPLGVESGALTRKPRSAQAPFLRLASSLGRMVLVNSPKHRLTPLGCIRSYTRHIRDAITGGLWDRTRARKAACEHPSPFSRAHAILPEIIRRQQP